MPFSISIDAERRRARITLYGRVEGTAFLEAMQAAYDAPGWAPGFDALWDVRRVTALVMSEQDVHDIVARTQAYTARMGPGRGAFVLARDVDWMITRLLMHRSASSGRIRRTFDTIDEAIAWLDAPEAP